MSRRCNWDRFGEGHLVDLRILLDCCLQRVHISSNIPFLLFATIEEDECGYALDSKTGSFLALYVRVNPEKDGLGIGSSETIVFQHNALAVF